MGAEHGREIARPHAQRSARNVLVACQDDGGRPPTAIRNSPAQKSLPLENGRLHCTPGRSAEKILDPSSLRCEPGPPWGPGRASKDEWPGSCPAIPSRAPRNARSVVSLDMPRSTRGHLRIDGPEVGWFVEKVHSAFDCRPLFTTRFPLVHFPSPMCSPNWAVVIFTTEAPLVWRNCFLHVRAYPAPPRPPCAGARRLPAACRAGCDQPPPVDRLVVSARPTSAIGGTSGSTGLRVRGPPTPSALRQLCRT